MVDYSKWDNLSVSSSEEESEEDGNADGLHSYTPRGAPQVTRLDEASRVTFGGGRKEVEVAGPDVGGSSGPEALQPGSLLPAAPSMAAPTPPKPPSPSSSSSSSSSTAATPPTKNGSTFLHESSNLSLSWSQTRDDVDLYIKVPTATKAPAVSVSITGALTWKDRESAVGTSTQPLLTLTLLSSSSSPPPSLSCRLPHPVYVGDADDADAEVEALQPDWEMKTFGEGRHVKISLKKAVPMAGMVLWWKTPVEGGAEIDVGEIADRTKGTGTAGGDGTYKEAWDEAHRMFKEKIKDKEKGKTEIDCGDGELAFPSLQK